MEKTLVVNQRELQDLFKEFNITVSPEEFMEYADSFGLVEEKTLTAPQRFAKLYLAYRRSMKHRNVHLIRPGNFQWKILTEVTTEAVTFCRENNLSQEEGFRLFLDVAGQVTNSMKLNEIRGKVDKIYEHFVAVEIVNGDPNKRLTQEIWDAMSEKFLNQTGRKYPVLFVPLQRQYFVEASALCKKYKVRPKEFVDMVVDEFAWLGFPKPYHLVGPRAEELCQRGYTEKYGAVKVKRVSLNHIKDIKDD